MSINLNVENMSSNSIRGIMNEIRRIVEEPLDGITVQFNETNICNIQAAINGPDDTPYSGGVFHVKLLLGKDYPQLPPKCYFLTKIFHPNVSALGEVCTNVLRQDWKPNLGIAHILLTVKGILMCPNAESALNSEAGKLLVENYDDFSQKAKIITDIYATPSNKITEINPRGDKEEEEPNAKKFVMDQKLLQDMKRDKLIKYKKCMFKRI